MMERSIHVNSISHTTWVLCHPSLSKLIRLHIPRGQRVSKDVLFETSVSIRWNCCNQPARQLKVESHVFTHFLDTSLTYRDIARRTGSELEGCPKDMAQLSVVVQHVETWKQGPPRVVDIQNLKLVLETLEPSRRHPFRQGEVLTLRGWRVGKKAAGQP